MHARRHLHKTVKRTYKTVQTEPWKITKETYFDDEIPLASFQIRIFQFPDNTFIVLNAVAKSSVTNVVPFGVTYNIVIMFTAFGSDLRVNSF